MSRLRERFAQWSEMVSQLGHGNEPLINFTERLISAPSENPPGDERQVVAVILDQLATLGLTDVQVVGPSEKRPSIICRVTGGTSGPTLLYNGHLDTKPVGDHSAWRTDPFTPVRKDGHIYGLGAADMKGAVAAMVFAAAVVNQNRDSLAGELLLILNADEEQGGAEGAGYIVDHCDIAADVALIGEASGISREWEYLHLLARGVCCFRIKVRGTQMHSSMNDIVPSINASEKMAWILSRMGKELKVDFEHHPLCPQGPTLAPGVVVRGGVSYGMLPGHVEFSSDVRTLPGMTRKGTERDIERFLDRLRAEDPDLDVELEIEEPPLGWKDAFEVSPSEPFLEVLLASADDVLGFRPPFGTLPGWTDSIWYQGRAGIPTIPAFGPGMTLHAHSPNESVTVDSLVRAGQIYSLAALRYLSPGED